MLTTRSSVGTRPVVVALLASLAVLAAGCGSDDSKSQALQPTFSADLAKRSSDPRGCVPNPRPAPRPGDPHAPGEITPTGIVVQQVKIAPDRSSSSTADDAMVASATMTGIARQPSIEAQVTTPSTTSTGQPAPKLAPERAGDRFVVVSYRLKNEGSVPTTPDQISGHLLLGEAGRWVAPTHKCRFPLKSSAAGASLQDTGALLVGAVPPDTVVKPNATVAAAATYVIHGDGVRWAASPTYTGGVTRLRPHEAGPGEQH